MEDDINTATVEEPLMLALEPSVVQPGRRSAYPLARVMRLRLTWVRGAQGCDPQLKDVAQLSSF